MDYKYSNIFWHQGIKIFKSPEKDKTKVEHLENDVTKSLMNLFEHCNPKILRAFLQLVDVKQAPQSFSFDFQVTDTSAYRHKSKRIMAAIISSATVQKPNPLYAVEVGIPDACIFNKDTAILIEAKTQSPLVEEQLESYIKQYLGSATSKKTITWEEISEKLKLVRKSLSGLDLFLVSHFCDFLELIGISEFAGFSASDFSMLGSIERLRKEDFLDFKRMFNRKLEKFLTLLDNRIRHEFSFKNYRRHVAKVSGNYGGDWCAFSFYNDDPSIHVNRYPNVNIVFNERGVELSVNAETKPSVRRIISRITRNPTAFNKSSLGIPDFNFLIFYKMQFLPLDNFIWKLIPGWPKRLGSFEGGEVISSINDFVNVWVGFKETLLFEMSEGNLKTSSGRFFTPKEIDFAGKRNPTPAVSEFMSQNCD